MEEYRLEDGRRICPTCENVYESIGQHWVYNRDHEPELTDKQRQITTGFLMGDGNIGMCSKTPWLRGQMETKEYLEHLNEEFPLLGRGVRKFRTPEEAAKQVRERGFNPNAKAENYQQTYEWYTTATTQFQEFADWYASGKKVWPDVEMTPLTLTHLYVCDGHLRAGSTENSRPSIQITMTNEREYKEKIAKMFRKQEIPEPRWYQNDAVWAVEETEELFEYMVDPLPGFSYKWPEEFK